MNKEKAIEFNKLKFHMQNPSSRQTRNIFIGIHLSIKLKVFTTLNNIKMKEEKINNNYLIAFYFLDNQSTKLHQHNI